MNTLFQKPIILHGFHSVESAIRRDAAHVTQVWLEEGRHDKRAQELIALMEKHRITYKLVDRESLETRAQTGKHQGVAAEYTNTETFSELHLPEILKKENVFLLVLDSVQDPHNLGACLRSANAAGIDAVIAPKDRAVGLTPAVRKIASGAGESTPFIQITNLSNTLQMLKDADVWCVGAAGEATDILHKTDLTGRLAIIMGSEGKGLRRLTRENCDSLVKIPMKGDVESLNVSVATGVILFEALRQRTEGS